MDIDKMFEALTGSFESIQRSNNERAIFDAAVQIAAANEASGRTWDAKTCVATAFELWDETGVLFASRIYGVRE